MLRGVKTRAAVLRAMGLPEPYRDSRPLSVETVVLDDPRAGEVLIEMRAAGLCHSDLSVINGDRPRPVPMVLGHEAAGIVRALGDGVGDLAVGDHVVMVFVPSCGGCVPCMSGRPALCEPAAVANASGALLSGERRLSFLSEGGQPAPSHRRLVLRRPRGRVAPVARQDRPRTLPFEHAALFGCAVLSRAWARS